MQKKTTGGVSGAMKLGVLGVSLAGLAASAYFFFGPKGKVHQRHAKAWVIKMKGDVVEKLERAADVSEAAYHEIIDSVAAEYKKKMKEGHEEVDALAQDLKKHWKTISKSARAIKHDVTKDVKKVAKKAGLK